MILASSGQHLSGGRQLGARPRLCVSVHRGLCLLRGGGEAAAGDQVALHLLLVAPAGGDTAAEQDQHQGRGLHLQSSHYLDTHCAAAGGWCWTSDAGPIYLIYKFPVCLECGQARTTSPHAGEGWSGHDATSQSIALHCIATSTTSASEILSQARGAR